MSHSDTFSKTILGFWVFLMSDCILFATLFATYAVLHSNIHIGPSIRELVNLPVVLTQTLLLLTASFVGGFTTLAAQQQDKKKVFLWLGITFWLGFSFMAIESAELIRLVHEGNNWQRSAFLSSFFNLIGTHGAHVAVGLLWIAVLGVHIVQHGITPVALKRLACMRLFWHFLNMVWVFIFTFVYLLGAA